MAELEPSQLFQYDRPVENALLDAVEIRNFFTALARNNYTTASANPVDPRDGQARVNAVDLTNIKLEFFIDGAWRVAVQKLNSLLGAPVKSIVQFDTPLASWVIDHNLGSQVVAQVFDASYVQLKPVNDFPVQSLPLAGFDTVFGTVPALSGLPFTFDGAIIDTYAVAETPLVGAGPHAVDFAINAAPITGGTIALAGPAAPGDVIGGAPVTAANTFVAGDVLDIVTSGAALASGIVRIWAALQRTLNVGEYRLTQVTENRITVDHPGPTTGFVVLLG